MSTPEVPQEGTCPSTSDCPNTLEQPSLNHGQLSNDANRSSKRKISRPKKYLPDDYNSTPNSSIPKCSTCNKSFLYYQSLLNHQKLHSKQSFKCPEPSCGKVYKTREYLKLHKKRVHQNMSFPCTICSSVLKSKDYLSRHMRSKHRQQQQKGFKCTEPGCNMTFSTGFLKSHIEGRRDGISTIPGDNCTVECPKCGKIYSNLKSHMKIHKEVRVKGFKCEADGCGKSFYSHYLLSIHAKFLHDPQDGYQCKICNKIFPKLRGFDRHKKICTRGGIAKFSCPKCPQMFLCKTYRAKHIKRKHRNEGVGTPIEMEMILPDGIPSLVGNVTGSGKKSRNPSKEKSLNFPCKFCDKIFAKHYILKKHENIHTKLLQFPCSICGKIFLRNYSLKKHQKIHLKSSEMKVAGNVQPLRIHEESVNQTRTEMILPDVEFPPGQSLIGIKPEKIQNSNDIHLGEIDIGIKLEEGEESNPNFGEDPDDFMQISLGKRSTPLEQNINQVHGKPRKIANPQVPKPIHCRFCEKIFLNFHTWKRHENIHTKTRQFICSICYKIYLRSDTLKKHEKTHFKLKEKKSKVIQNQQISEKKKGKKNIFKRSKNAKINDTRSDAPNSEKSNESFLQEYDLERNGSCSPPLQIKHELEENQTPNDIHLGEIDLGIKMEVD